MSTSGYQQLPRYLVYFALNVKGIDCPKDVSAILNTFDKAINAKTPRTTMNRGLTRLKKSRPCAVQQLIDWTCSDAVILKIRKKGAWWVISPCLRAFQKLSLGITPHVAFGMNLPGKRPGMNFSISLDAVLLANYWIQEGKKQNWALDRAQGFREQCLRVGSDCVPDFWYFRARLFGIVGKLDRSLVDHLERKYHIKIQMGD